MSPNPKPQRLHLGCSIVGNIVLALIVGALFHEPGLLVLGFIVLLGGGVKVYSK